MKTILAMIAVVIATLGAIAQNKPVKWTCHATKVSGKTYEVKLSATVDNGWHIYSQTMDEGGPLPTKITFNKNPLITVSGLVREVGNLITRHEDVFSMDTRFYAGKVEFVQKVKLKSNVKTNIAGTVTFMVCTDTQCLPPATFNFSLGLK